MTQTIFTTVHGSRLYGFAHEGSDYDLFTVTDSRSRKVSHSVEGQFDRITVGIWHFLDLAMGGSHQSVEALFSPVKSWIDTPAAWKFRPLLDAVRVQGSDVFAKYERTIRKFAYGDFKRRRHAIRLSHNLTDLRRWGVFNPRVEPEVVESMTWLAERLEGDELAKALGVLRG